MQFGDDDNYDGRDLTKTAQMLFNAHKLSEDAFKPLRGTRWPRDYKLYHGIHDLSMFPGNPNEYPLDSQVFIPTALQQVETATPRLCETLMENDPLVRVKPLITDREITQKEHYVQWASRVEALLHNQLVVDVDLEANLGPWVRDALIYGTKWMFVEWFSRRGTDWRMVPKVKNGEESDEYELKEFKNELLEDRVKVTGRPIWSVFPDPEGTSIETCRFIQQVMFMSIDTLWQWIEGTKQAKKWKVTSKKELESLQGSVKGEERWLKVQQAEVGKLATGWGKGWTPKKEDNRLIRILDHWENDWHIVLAGQQDTTNQKGRQDPTYRILLIERNPFKKLGIPFRTIRPTPLADELYGLGLVDMIEDLVHHVNTLTNLRLVNLERAINNIILVDTTSGLNANEMLSQPAAIYNVDGTVQIDKCVHMIEWPSANNEQWQEADAAQAQIQATTGLSDMHQGQVAEGFNDTARGIGYLIEQGNIRFGHQVRMVGVSLRHLAEAILAVDQQFIGKIREERITQESGAEDFRSVHPDMIARQYVLRFDVRPEAANKGLQMQQIIDATQIFGNWPEFRKQTAIRRVMQLSGASRPEEFLTKLDKDAHWENDGFRRFGKMGPVSRADQHEFHFEVHNALFADGSAESHGQAALDGLLDHIQDHLEAAGMLQRPPAGGGGMGGAPAVGAAGGGEAGAAPLPGPPPQGAGGGAPAPAPAGGVGVEGIPNVG